MDGTEQTLRALLAEISACTLCIDKPRGRRLPHTPRPVVLAARSARILIAGQAPGMRVHQSGRPFTDPSGDRLRQWMALDEDTFYDTAKIAIVPMGFCFPGHDAKGGDLPPRRECADAWQARVMAHLEKLELILAIGQYAQAWHLGPRRGKTLTDTVLAWRQYAGGDNRPEIVPLPHPSWRNNAWLKKNPWFERELLPHLRIAVKRALDGTEAVWRNEARRTRCAKT